MDLRNIYFVHLRHLFFLTLSSFFFLFTSNLIAQINFSQSTLNFGGLTNISGATSMEFGPDGRLYIADYPGDATASGVIRALTIQRNGPTNYVVTAVENLTGVSTIPNHNDDGTPAPSVNGKRQVTGLTIVGTASNPVVYVTSSDIRIGGGTGTGEKDSGLDTNSGVITRMTWTGDTWDIVDIVRGLPRSEENHATNGLEFATINGTDYLFVATGGFTNSGAPSSNFALITEYALSAAVLSINLTQLNQLPILTDNGRSYVYDLPTMDDPTRPNANGINDPDTAGYDGVDLGDPWGGNDGLNQSKLVPGGPVQILTSGYRNCYDLVLTQSGALYVTDNGANGGWGGFPENEGLATVTNNYNPAEPGSSSASGGEQVNNKDHLEMVTADIQNYTFGSFYAGHPNPLRANPSGAGLYTDNKGALGITGSPIFRTQLYDPNGSTPGSTTNANIGLPADWPPIPVSMANTVESDWRGPGINNPDGPNDNPIVIWDTNTNGITEYTASNFNNAMKGNLMATHSGGNLHRVQLNTDGTSQQLTQNFLSGIGGFTLGITANGDDQVFPGTIWAGTINGIIAVFEPQDAVVCIVPSDPSYDPSADYDLDGYSNQDEEDNGTDPCNGGSQPNDFDKILGAPLVSDLNDPDDDSDGIPDAIDPMQLGNPLAVGSQSFNLPIYNDFFNDQQSLGGIFGLGLTGLMNNGDTGSNWLNWLDDRDQGPNPNDVLGGAVGLMTSHMTSGTALGSLNTQDKGYQYGVRVGTSTGTFTVTGAMTGFIGELRLYGNTEAVGGELGFQIGDGTQSNYIKFVITTAGFLALQEINDVPQTPISFNLPLVSRPTNEILFHFVVNPSNGQVLLEYQIDEGIRATLGTITAQGSILNAIQEMGSDLMVGLIGTSNTPGVELEGTWDFLNVVPENAFALRINAGGPQTLNSGVVVFSADQNYVGGATYANTSAQVPDLYKTERSSPSQTFSYDIPLENGNYTVNLHFAEIYWGATGGGTGGVGNRIFDVSIEGSLLLDNYDIYADVGPETVVIKSFPVTISDGQLDIDFSALASVGGVDQPKISALEVFGNTPQGMPIIVNAIADQISVIGEQLNGSLSVVASGGDGNLSYSALNLPPGLFIEPTNGQLGGTVSESASVTTPYTVTIIVDDSDDVSTDTKTVSFLWNIIDNTSPFEVRINAGGPQLLSNGEVFYADQNFVDGASYANTSAQVPDLYKTERTSPSQTFSYDIPLENGNYTVNLHFAEIYWGATGGGTGGVGNRIFDVNIEGSLLLDNYDIYADVGPETVVVKSFQVTVSDGQLDIDFSALASVGGIDQPKLSALEVLGNSLQNVPIIVNVIADQTSDIGQQLDGSLSVEASGGDGNLNYTALNLPPGLFIEPTNGQIGGTISESASVITPYNVTITVDDSDDETADAVTTSFIWTVTSNTAPSISIITPLENTTFTTPTNLNITAAASDIDGTILKVEFFQGTTKLGEDLDGGNGWSYTWNNVPVGMYSLTAIATDDKGAQTTSAMINITVSNPPSPVITSFSPTSGPVGTLVTINGSNLANASSVSFGPSIAQIILNTDTKIEALVPSVNGRLPSKVKITVTTIGGSFTSSARFTITSGTVPINASPVVVIDSPVNNASFTAPASIGITASASDPDGTVVKVEFFNGDSKLDEDLTSPYAFTWSNVAIGNYFLTAKAIDDMGAVTTSAAINISVSSSANSAPVVTITSPGNNSNFTSPASIGITASASDPDGTVVKVEFFNGDSKLGEDLTNPYGFIWNNVVTGNYSLTAKAIDNEGSVSTSSSVNITVGSSSALTAPSYLLAQWASNSQVNLNWQDNSFDEDSFVLERASKANFTGNVEIINLSANTISYQDLNLNNRRALYYRIKAVRGGVSSAYSNIVSPSDGSLANKETVSAPDEELILKDSFVVIPNPSSGKSTIQFVLPENSGYSLILYNSQGAFIYLVKQGKAEAGVQYTHEFDGSHLANGLYLLRLDSQIGVQTFRLLISR